MENQNNFTDRFSNALLFAKFKKSNGKVCSKCGTFYEDVEENFWERNHTRDGYHSMCKACEKKQHTEYIQRMRTYPEWVARENARAKEYNEFRNNYYMLETENAKICRLKKMRDLFENYQKEQLAV